MKVENLKEFWKASWNELAGSNNMFVQTGRSSYTSLEFFLMIGDICKELNLEKEDIVLDAGGGAGWISMCISPFVKQIVLFDYAEEMINKARKLIIHFGNIRAEHDDVCFMEKVRDKKYKKVIVGSVLQYLENYGQVETSLHNIHSVMLPTGKAIFTHNPDIRKKEAHIHSYNRLNWSQDKMKEALETEQKRFWLDMNKIKEIASKVGFSGCYEVPINPKLWQSTHMFDFVVEK